MEKSDLLNIFLKTDALLNGHFLLTSGRHSNQYFQCAKVLQYPNHTTSICRIIADYFKDYEIDTVISPAIGGIVVGQEVARLLNKRFIFAERENKNMTLRRGFKIDEGEKILVCEDVVTTGGSVFEVIDIVKNNKAVVGVPQTSTLEMEVVSYLPDECPLCKDGTPAVKPGSRKIS